MAQRKATGRDAFLGNESGEDTADLELRRRVKKKREADRRQRTVSNQRIEGKLRKPWSGWHGQKVRSSGQWADRQPARAHMHIQTRTQTYTCTRTHTYAHTHMHAHTRLRTRTCRHTRMHTHLHAHMCTHTYTRTHARTRYLATQQGLAGRSEGTGFHPTWTSLPQPWIVALTTHNQRCASHSSLDGAHAGHIGKVRRR